MTKVVNKITNRKSFIARQNAYYYHVVPFYCIDGEKWKKIGNTERSLKRYMQRKKLKWV